jgi:pyrroloquinoline-quinone synthase
MTFWDRLAQVRTEHDVLRHPFYLRWSAGELTHEELAVYAGQYRFAAVALAEASASAAAAATPELAPALEEHAREESGHVALWDDFATAVKADPAPTPLAETASCARVWAGAGRSLPETLAALYAIEAAQPAISEAKRVGLRDHYGITDPKATAYFDIHVAADVEHAASDRQMLELLIADADEDELLRSAEDALVANWRLLDGVEAARVGAQPGQRRSG